MPEQTHPHPITLRRHLAALFFAVILAMAEIDRASPISRPIPIVMQTMQGPLPPPRLHRIPVYRRLRA